jgi:hypothetical protein
VPGGAWLLYAAVAHFNVTPVFTGQAGWAHLESVDVDCGPGPSTHRVAGDTLVVPGGPTMVTYRATLAPDERWAAVLVAFAVE